MHSMTTGSATNTPADSAAQGAHQGQATPNEPQTPATPRSTFWIFFWFALAACGAKTIPLGVPGTWSVGQWTYWGRELAIACSADVLFALLGGLVGQLVLSLFRACPRAQRILWTALLCLGALGTAYTVADVPVFAFFRAHLTYDLIDLAGGIAGIPRRAAQFMTAGLAAATLAAPVFYVLLVWLTDRRIQPRRRWFVRAAQIVCIALILCYVAAARAYVAGSWRPYHDDRRLADSPHWTILCSLFGELWGAGTTRCAGRFAPEDVADFQVAARRPDHGRITPDLPRSPRNVILIVLESVGTRYLSLYGCKYPTTPRLSAESQHALVFDNACSLVTNSGNSLVALVLSVYAPMSWREYILEHPQMPGDALPRILRDRGYRTAFISSCNFSYANGLAFLANRGFDVVWDYRDLGRRQTAYWGVDDAAMIDKALDWIGPDPDRPFFLLCWNQGTHHPYDPAPGQEEIDFFKGDKPHDDWDLGHYLNALHYTDRQLGRLFDALRRRGLAHDTAVIITGDHGEAFGVPHKSYGHSGKIYQEDVNVPFLIWSPALFKAPPRSQTAGGLIDVGPTILDLLGIDLPPTWQGHSLLSPSHPSRAYFYGSKDDYLLGVRDAQYKYIANVSQGREELYDLSKDPDEQQDLAPSHPQRCLRTRQRLAAWLDYQMRMYR
jgi:arylsulfatase A-like enzyme